MTRPIKRCERYNQASLGSCDFSFAFASENTTTTFKVTTISKLKYTSIQKLTRFLIPVCDVTATSLNLVDLDLWLWLISLRNLQLNTVDTETTFTWFISEWNCIDKKKEKGEKKWINWIIKVSLRGICDIKLNAK